MAQSLRGVFKVDIRMNRYRMRAHILELRNYSRGTANLLLRRYVEINKDNSCSKLNRGIHCFFFFFSMKSPQLSDTIDSSVSRL